MATWNRKVRFLAFPWGAIQTGKGCVAPVEAAAPQD
jgi:hypothetical protein